MRSIYAAAFVLLLSGTAAMSQSELVLQGKTFVRKHEQIRDGAGLVEFVPAGETLENWTSLVGFRVVPGNRQSATEAATVVVRLAQERYPGAVVRVMSKDAEAIAEFVISTPEGLAEFNVFKYGPGPGGRGLASVQYAHRYRGLEPGDIRRLEAPSTAAIARFDLDRVRAAFDRTPPDRADRGPAS